jgi:riboflavin synthase
MFTGLIQGTGTVLKREEFSLEVELPLAAWPDPVSVGESIAVNGACLTVKALSGTVARFEISTETWKRTALGELNDSSQVNLERSLRVGDRLGGHIVQGHVDGVGEVVDVQQLGEFLVIHFRAPDQGHRYLIDKGSIAIDGISLTVVQPSNGQFSVWLVPHTIQETNLSSRRIGDRVNMEFDAIAKYVEQLLVSRAS